VGGAGNVKSLGAWWGRGALALLGTLLTLGATPIAGQAGPAGPAVSPRAGFSTASQEIISTGQAVGGMPSPASSYYVFGAFQASCGPTATSGCPLYVDGADEPSPSNGALVVLDFGAPCFTPATTGPPIYGTQLFNTTSCTTDDQLLPLAQAFVHGYQSTHGAGSPLAIIALGTSNSLNGVNTGHALTGPQMHDSGQAWFTNLVQPFGASLAGPALIVPWAANDIEGSSSGNFYDPTLTTPWVDGYGSAAATSLGGTKFCAGNDPYRMADYGDDVLTNGWTDSLYYQVAWGAPVACAVPEIYVTANATQWQRTSQWGVSNGHGPITFTGPMSLGGEAGTLSSQDSWNALASATGQSPPYLTVIGSLFPSTPSPPTNVVAFAGDTTATVWWSATPASADGGSAVQDYTVTAFAGTTPGPSATVDGLPPPTTATVRGLVNGTAYTFVVTATNSGGAGPASAPSNSVVPGPGRYHPLAPTRILDTRNGTGGFSSPIGPQARITLPVVGRAPVPSSAVAAVVMNVTVTDTTAASYLTVFPSQLPQPTASNLNWIAGITVPNLVEVPVGPDGGVTFFNAAGSVNVIADIEGYVGAANETAGLDGLYAPVTPTRVLDTRSGVGGVAHPVGPGAANVIAVPVAQAGQEAVVLNVTITNPTAAGYLTVWPDGTPQPVVSNLNFKAGQTVANRVAVKVGSSGKVDFFNAAGSVSVIADLNGSFTDTTGGAGSQFQGIQPKRLLDTRDGTGGIRGPLAAGGSLSLQVTGTNGIPSSAVAIVANLTVTDTTGSSYLTAWPDLATRPTASDLNWVAGQTVPNLVVVGLGTNGKLDIYNAAGSTDVILDIVGYYR
jgi:Fibronectin type III domain